MKQEQGQATAGIPKNTAATEACPVYTAGTPVCRRSACYKTPQKGSPRDDLSGLRGPFMSNVAISCKQPRISGNSRDSHHLSLVLTASALVPPSYSRPLSAGGRRAHRLSATRGRAPPKPC